MANSGQKIKIATVCSGIGSPEQALKELDIPHEISFACEIDKYARQTYLANFTPNQMYQDLTAEEWDKPKQYSDLFIGGIPCQAFSLAGKRLGELDKRGLLFYDFYRYVKNQQPKVFIIENVKGLLSDNNGITFQNWCALLGQSMNTHLNMFNHDDSLLYNLHFKVLNSKDFGVPQNRERVFLIGIRNDLPNNFRFPIGERLKIRLKDILETEVDEKYYLSENAMEYLNKGASGGYSDRMTFLNKSENAVAGCITANHSKGIPYNMLQEPYCVAMRGRNPENPSDRTTEQRLEPNSQGITNTITSVQKDNLVVVNEAPELMMMGSLEGGKWDKMHESIRRYYSPNGISPTVTAMGGGNQEPKIMIDTACNQAVVVNDPEIINPLKDKTEFGWHFEQNVFSDESITRALKSSEGSGNKQKVILNQRIRRLTPLECMRLQGYPDSYIKPCSDSQTYKQAGNSITVNVMKAIIKNLIPVL
jgi:DNA (cytosine-5)-methyltransferase 1